jgi:hypothetical protein
MEGAIESGKITANYILDKYNKQNIEHYKHDAPFYIKLIQYIDNILYKLYLPNIVNLLIILILFFILYKIYIINAKHIKKILRMVKMGRYILLFTIIISIDTLIHQNINIRNHKVTNYL